MKASEILELVRAGYTRAEIDAMNDETPPVQPATEQAHAEPAPQTQTAPATPPAPVAQPAPVDAQHLELMKAIQGLTAAVQMGNIMQTGSVGAPSGGMTAEKALSLGTFGGGQNG